MSCAVAGRVRSGNGWESDQMELSIMYELGPTSAFVPAAAEMRFMTG